MSNKDISFKEISDNFLPVLDQVYHRKESEWPSYKEGSLFESAVIEAVENLQIPKEMAITSALGAMATACQGIADIAHPMDNENRIIMSLMLLVIAESGERKTTTEKYFFNSLKDRQDKEYEKFEKSKLPFMAEEEVWKQKRSALTARFKQAIKGGKETCDIESELKEHIQSEPKPFNYHKFIYEDSTPQALISMMNEHSKNACLLSSEANSIFNGRALQELNLVNSLWDGGHVYADRVSKGSFILKNARLTLALMTQFSVIDKFMDKRGEEARGMGFLARFLVVKPEKKAGKRVIEPRVSSRHIKKFHERIEERINEARETELKGLDKKVIGFTASAEQLWKLYAQKIEEEMKPYGLYEHYKDHGSKLMDNISRVAGVIQCFETPDEPVDEQTLRFSYDLCLRYSKHFMDHLAGEPCLIKNANKLVSFLLREAYKELQKDKGPKPRTEFMDGIKYFEGYKFEFDRNIIQRSGPSELKKDKNGFQAFYKVIELLEKMGHVFSSRNNTSDKSSTKYTFYQVVPLKQKSSLAKSIDGDGFMPEIKNGYEFNLDSLPIFDDLKTVSLKNAAFANFAENKVRMMPIE